MQFRVGMEGWSQDHLVSVRCTLVFDPDEFYVVSQGFGRLLALPYQLEIEPSVHSQNSPYAGGSAVLLVVSGWLGAHSTSWNLTIPQTVASGRQVLAVPLQDRDVEAIENFRAGAEVVLNIALNGLVNVFATQKITFTPQSRYDFPFVNVISVASDGPASGSGTQIRIGREKWLALLKQAGRTRMLVELPMPQLTNAKPWEEAARLLTVAEQYHRTGDYESVPEKCREVFEGLLSMLAAQWNVPKPSDDSFEKWTKEVVGRLKARWPESDAEQAETLALLLNAGRLWSRSSHHFGAGIPKREEAAFILHLTTNLFAFCVQLAQAFPDPLVPKE